MKPILLMGTVLFSIFTSCQKQRNDTAKPPAYTADFRLKSPNVYINGGIHVDLDLQPGATYNWDFGDGSTQITSGLPAHNYQAGGIYTVTLKVGNASSSRKLRVFPGTTSRRYFNHSTIDWKSVTIEMIDPATGKLIDPGATITSTNVKQNAATDTLFVNVPQNLKTGLDARWTIKFTTPSAMDVTFIGMNKNAIPYKLDFSHVDSDLDNYLGGIAYYLKDGKAVEQGMTFRTAASLK